MSNGLSDRLQDLKSHYCRQLPDRIKEIDRSLGELSDESWRSALERLRLQAHKIAGSGAIFGFDTVSSVGRKLENAVDLLLQNEAGIDAGIDADQREEIAELASELESECAKASLGYSGEEIEVKERQIALAAPGRSSDLDDLSEQLSYFGYDVAFVSTFEALRLFAESSPNGLAIVHTDFVTGAAGLQGELESMSGTLEHEFHFVFLSERTDYHARLTALRSGGAAYFVLPLDIARLLDRIESLTGRADEAPYHILIVDDDPDQVSYYALILQQAGMITSVASDPRTVLNILSEAKPELILMDMYMPGCSGTELLRIIRQQEAFVGVPVVFLSVEDNESKKFDAIRHGGDDFLTKPVSPDYLVASVTNRVERTRSIRFFMERDSLTGLLNHTNLREQLIREIARARRNSTTLCFAMIDLDHFKSVNDTHGHLTGDRVLKGLSRILQDRLRRTDIVGRYGGEEFGVVLINTEESGAVEILDEIRQNFEKVRHQGESAAFYVTFSCGVACLSDGTEIDDITNAADTALYRAKEEGRNRIIRASDADS